MTTDAFLLAPPTKIIIIIKTPDYPSDTTSHSGNSPKHEFSNMPVLATITVSVDSISSINYHKSTSDVSTPDPDLTTKDKIAFIGLGVLIAFCLLFVTTGTLHACGVHPPPHTYKRADEEASSDIIEPGHFDIEHCCMHADKGSVDEFVDYSDMSEGSSSDHDGLYGSVFTEK
jgi:hypothetical protein